ncbi:MAG: adenylate/guanylate cyclase domain-containing protein [Dehalococcoidia bacterium]
MASKRVQRQLDRLLDAAEDALAENEWATVRARCRAVLALDPGNEDAETYMQAADRAGGPVALDVAGGGAISPASELFTRAAEAVGAASQTPGGRGAGRYLRGLFGSGHRPRRDGGRESGSSVEAVVSRVLAERLNIAPFVAPSGTVTLLISDIESSVRINAELGDQAWMNLLHEHNDLVRGEFARHGGFEVKNQGDGFMVAFGSAASAVRSSIGMQELLEVRNEQAKTAIRVRIGIHTGESIRESDDFFGGHVNFAARVAEQAHGAEIVVSSLLRQLVEPSGEFRFVARPPVELKGLEGTFTLHDVDWLSDDGDEDG